MRDVGAVGERAGEGGLAEQLSGMLEFQPYTVTSATGGQFGMTPDPDTGEMTYQLQTSPEENYSDSRWNALGCSLSKQRFQQLRVSRSI